MYRLQNHAPDLPTAQTTSDALMILADTDAIPTIIQIPKQIQKQELLQLMPLEWTTHTCPDFSSCLRKKTRWTSQVVFLDSRKTKSRSSKALLYCYDYNSFYWPRVESSNLWIFLRRVSSMGQSQR